MRKYLLVSLLGLQLAGCAAVTGFPNPIMTERQENDEIAAYLSNSPVAGYDKCPDQVLCRNTIVDARLRAVDLAFYRFQRKIYAQDSRVSLGSDVLTMALSSGAIFAATGGLAAGAGLLTGGRDAFKKQIRSVSLPLLFEQMTAKRREVLLRIRLGQRVSASSYTLFQALDDVSEYELAGSIPAAAAELGASVGQSSRTAQIQLDALRATSLASASVAVGMPAVASSTATPATSGTVVYTSNSGTASVSTVMSDPRGKPPASSGSVIYTTESGPGSVASIIPVPPSTSTPKRPSASTSAASPAPVASPTPLAPANAGKADNSVVGPSTPPPPPPQVF